MRLTKYLFIANLWFQVFPAVIFVAGGLNTLKTAIGNSSSGDVFKLRVGAFCNDQINITKPMSVVGF